MEEIGGGMEEQGESEPESGSSARYVTDALYHAHAVRALAGSAPTGATISIPSIFIVLEQGLFLIHRGEIGDLLHVIVTPIVPSPQLHRKF
jgi:hypothetical protein